ncbi:uncharacterized protein V2V93DRAFT_374563 [Kockiozyma suomiensis]|uniref:uncharacterized protein n=1 Tax=Kockiozyma suomiensis TaxID=1337062 RepID=UPI003344238E
MTAFSDLSLAEPDKDPVASLHLSLLMVSGLRYALNIDNDYLEAHSLTARDPESLSVETLKQCIFADWKEDWGERPSATDFIRLIHFGRLLNDKDTLSDSNLSRSNMYNVLHMSVRPVSLAGVANSPTAKSRSSLLAAADAIRPRRQNIVDNDRVAHPVTVSTSSAVDNSHSYGTAPGAEARNAGCGCVII